MSELAYEMGYKQALRDVCASCPDIVNDICLGALLSGHVILERRLGDLQAEISNAHNQERDDAS